MKLSLKVVKTHSQGPPLIRNRPGIQPTIIWLQRWQKPAADTLLRGCVCVCVSLFFMNLNNEHLGGWFSRDHHPPHFLLCHLLSLPGPWRHCVWDPCFQAYPLSSTWWCHLLWILSTSVPTSRRVLAGNDFHDLSWSPAIHTHKGKSSSHSIWELSSSELFICE